MIVIQLIINFRQAFAKPHNVAGIVCTVRFMGQTVFVGFVQYTHTHTFISFFWVNLLVFIQSFIGV